MKKLFGILLLALANSACQPVSQSASLTAQAAAPVTPDSLASLQPSPFPPPTQFSAADTLNGPARALLQQYDLAKLWRSYDRPQEPTLEGFFGPDHYRFTLVITGVRRTAQRPDVYVVQGKYRYHQAVRSFAGQLTIRRVTATQLFYSPASGERAWVALPKSAIEQAGLRYRTDQDFVPCYSVLAQLRLTEIGSATPSRLAGESLLTCYLAPHHACGYAPAKDVNEPNWYSSLLLRGTHRDSLTHQTSQFAVADNVLALAPSVYDDFVGGDRGIDINSKYAKLGWDTYWQNDEWWAEDNQRHGSSPSLHPKLFIPPAMDEL